MAALQVALHALRAELALVERELVPGLEADDLVVLHLQLDAALLAAEAAVRLDHAVDLEAGVPAAGRRLVEVRPVPGDELLVGDAVVGPSAEPSDACRLRERDERAPARGQVSW